MLKTTILTLATALALTGCGTIKDLNREVNKVIEEEKNKPDPEEQALTTSAIFFQINILAHEKKTGKPPTTLDGLKETATTAPAEDTLMPDVTIAWYTVKGKKWSACLETKNKHLTLNRNTNLASENAPTQQGPCPTQP